MHDAALPLTTYSGFLKQHAHSELDADERSLFEWLFPGFADEDEDEIRERTESAREQLKAFGGLFEAVPGEPRQRRFAGPNLPRSRYFSVCQRKTGDDNQTLAHELRAYRNPAVTGLVEVIDLANGCKLQLASESVPFPPEPSIAVIVHEFNRLPLRLQSMPFEELPSGKETPLHLYRFGYKVYERRLESVVDLRLPQTRAWFYDAFQVTSEALDPLPKDDPAHTTAYSAFHLENQYPPSPKTFWDMLPTLVNPDRGGGNPATTGSTVQYIGHWLREHGVDAFIYPSARADVEVILEDGKVERFAGWNLVYYGDAPMWVGQAVRSTCFDLSPWAWQRFVEGAALEVAPDDSALAGSFRLTGVVDYWAQDTLYQLRAVEAARGKYASLSIEAAPMLPRHAYLLGGLCFQWLRIAAGNPEITHIDDSILDLVGVSLPYGLYGCTGRVRELWRECKRRGGLDFPAVLHECLGLCDRLARSIENRYRGSADSSCVLLGGEIEQALLWITLGLRRKDALAMVEHMEQHALRAADGCSLLPDVVREEIAAFFRAVTAVSEDGGADIRSLLDSGERLSDRVYTSLPRESLAEPNG